MIKKLKIFVILTLLSPLSFCQVSYPNEVLIGKDTICQITIPQLRAINVSLVELDGCRELTDTLKSIVKKQDFAITSQRNLMSSYDNRLSVQQTIIDNDQIIINVYKGLDKTNQTKIKWLKLQRNVISIIAISALAKILVFH